MKAQINITVNNLKDNSYTYYPKLKYRIESYLPLEFEGVKIYKMKFKKCKRLFNYNKSYYRPLKYYRVHLICDIKKERFEELLKTNKMWEYRYLDLSYKIISQSM